MKIENVNLEITDACNLRCTMCDIWKEKKNNYFTAGMINDIFSSDVLSEAVDVTLTGGEVFLHPELFSLVERIQHFRPKGIRTLSTNGVLTEEIMSFMGRFYDTLSKDFSIHISFDGVNAHDAQRGMPSKHKVLDTIKLLKKDYRHLPVKIKYTITPSNYSDVLETYFFCKKNKLEFKPKIVEYAPHYTNRFLKRAFVFTDEQKIKIREDLLCVNAELKSPFISESIEFLYGRNEFRYCLTPFNRAFIMSTGDVFSCIHFAKIGNIKTASLEAMWYSSTAKGHQNRMEKGGCRKCVSYHGAGK